MSEGNMLNNLQIFKSDIRDYRLNQVGDEINNRMMIWISDTSCLNFQK